MRIFLLGPAALLCSICLFPVAANAQTVFDNFGPGNTFQTSIGWTESGPTSSVGTASQGEGFTPSSTGLLSSIDIALGHVSGTNDAHLFLADGVPGTLGTNTLEA